MTPDELRQKLSPLDKTTRDEIVDAFLVRNGQKMAALEIAGSFGNTDGAAHKQWVIDQMVRRLTGCPKEGRVSEEYKRFRAAYDEWDTGRAP